MAPEAHEGLVLGAPLGVGLGQLLVHGHTGVLQALHQVDLVGRVHVAAGAVPHVEPVQLHPAEHRHRFLGLQGENGVVVFQQDGALCRRLTAQSGQMGLDVLFAEDGPTCILCQDI